MLDQFEFGIGRRPVYGLQASGYRCQITGSNATRNLRDIGNRCAPEMALFLLAIHPELTQVRHMYYPLTVFVRLGANRDGFT